MGNFTYLVKECWFRMIPFGIAIAVYSVLVQFEKTGETWTAVTKCSPVVALILFILFFGLENLKTYAYPRRILLGLVFSCAGDALLDIDLFEFGVGAFLLAQICYIAAFGFKPFMWWIGVALYICAAVLTGILLKYMDPIARSGLPIYALFLTTMSWRALSRIWILDDSSLLLTRIICGVGSLLFTISDSLIAINKYYVYIPNSGLYIMITYYAAQFSIALSILPPNGQDSKLLLVEARADEGPQNDGGNAGKGARLAD